MAGIDWWRDELVENELVVRGIGDWKEFVWVDFAGRDFGMAGFWSGWRMIGRILPGGILSGRTVLGGRMIDGILVGRNLLGGILKVAGE